MPLTADHGLLAVAKARSGNKKIGDAAATYAAQASCPTSCSFFDGGGCYAENGLLFSSITNPLNQAAKIAGASIVEIAQAEADAIDALEIVPGFPLRLHTVGDCRTDEAATIVAAAAERYMARGGGKVWTYTHAWRIVDRASWGAVSVLASCETPEQVELARARGYAPSIVVAEFPTHRRYEFAAQPDPNLGGQRPGREGAPVTCALTVLPCPAQTRHDVSCSSCRLCLDDQGIIGRGYAIGFEVHGTAFTIRQARRALEAPSDAERKLTLRTLIPRYLAEHPDATLREIAEALGYNESSVAEMRAKLDRERIAA